ncbi:PREDICTED: golgin subfamily A member 6-like protein 22 [Camelina sativa]|uniref:Golgin subfamily A member 6-like protein 22 n=1 Tax=Camelina sativa TaxID=90675 RepID=A0ABM0UDL4_CAMSA|nr:PREDICTED: golgin subfamily A member 6-like protein 22 [Camelina sativa]
MEMASSEVDLSSCRTFNCVLSRPHERCTRGGDNNNKNNSNNVRNIHVAAYEKNLNVFVRDHFENCSVVSDEYGINDSTKSSVCSHHRATKTEEPRHDVSSSSSSLGSESNLNSGQPENPSRKETMAASSLVQIWEARTTQQPPSSNQTLIDSRTSSMGSNALENSDSLNEEFVKDSELLIQPIEEGNNEEEEEEEEVEEIECVSQLVLPPPVSGEKDREKVRVMDIIRKLSNESETLTNNDNGSSSNDNSKDVQTTEARCFPQVTCSPRIRGRQAFADLLVQMMRDREKELACLLERHCVSKFTHRGRIQSTLRIRCYERCKAIQDRHRCKPSSAGSDLNRSPRGSGVMHLLRGKYKANSENTDTASSSSTVSSRGRILDKDKATEKKVLQEKNEKNDIKENQEVVSAVDNANKAVLSDITENKNGLKKAVGETIQKKATTEGRDEKRETKEKDVAKESPELAKEKAVAKEIVEGKALGGIAEKVNIWNSEEKINRRKGKFEGKANTERIEKNDVLEEATRRIINVESAERSITTTAKETMMPRCEFTEKVIRRKENEDCVSMESKSKELEDRNIKPQELTKQEDNCLCKPIERESVEEGNTLMGIAEKVNMWNSKEKKHRRRVMEKGKGNTETNEVLQEASRRISNVETAERSISTSRQTTVEKVVGSKEVIASVEAKSKEIVEDKNMNPQAVSHGSRERDKEKNSSQHGEKTPIMQNSEAKSTKEIERNNSQEVTQEDKSVSHGSRETDKERIYLQHDEAKSSKEIDGNNSQEVTQEEGSISKGSRERAKGKSSSQQDEKMENGIKDSEDEETKKVERKEKGESVKEAAAEFVNEWDENEMEEEDEYGDYDLYIGENMDDWIHDISRPRSYWEDLRKERYLEVLNTESEKKDICNLIQRRTVSDFLTSDLRQKIDNLMITRVQSHIRVPISQVKEEDEDEEEEEEKEEWVDECSARNQEDNETEEEPEKPNLEAASDVYSQSSARSSTMMSWTFRDQDIYRDHEPTTTLSLPESSAPTTQSESQTISELRSQIEQLQREMLEIKSSVKSCIDFQKFVAQDLSRSGSSVEARVDSKKDPLKRKCCVCSEMPVDSLLYRCGHMCTCLKCAHELQWSSKKCPICMAPIVDVVRAFLDS